MKKSKDEKRQDLLKAARSVIMEYGLQKTTLDDIARHAGMAKTSLYYYFQDKDEIIRAIIRSDMEELLVVMTRAVDAAQTAGEKLRAMIESRYTFIATVSSRVTKELLNEFKTFTGDYFYVDELEQYKQAQMRLLQGILMEGIAKGELQPIEDIELVALIIFSSITAIDWTFTLYDQRDRIMEGIKALMTIFYAGLSRPKQQGGIR